MRNTEFKLIREFVSDIQPFMEAAKKYVAEHGDKKYPKVYYAKTKDGKYGVTLPGVFDIGHSANNCPDGYNNLIFATAWAMKVDALLKMGDYTYLEWCRKYNYLNRKNNDWVTGFEYIRRNPAAEEGKEKKYSLYIPITGKGYKKVLNSKETPDFTSLKKALYRRDQKLYTLINRGTDENGSLPEGRVKKYKRLLVKGYFQSIFIEKQTREDEIKEVRNARYRKNRETIANVFANAINFCEDEVLKSTFKYFRALLTGELSLLRVNEFDSNLEYLNEYFKAISLFPDIIKSINGIVRNEIKWNRISLEKLLNKHN